MCRTKTLSLLVATAILAMSAGVANAQSDGKTGRGWGARALSGSTNPARVSRPGDTTAAPESSASHKTDATAAKAKGLTGTWRVSIPTSDGGLAPFNAYHTFTGDGTFVEVSDLLTTQTESPAHGVWSGKKQDYQLTFELFVFDPGTKEPAGRVRVRCAITLAADGDSFTANTVVDFIAPDGSVAEGVDSGPFSGTRVKVVPITGT
jgi:hypothetical protein